MKEVAVYSSMEFFTSWTFILIMAGLLCLVALLIPIFIVLAIVFVRRAQRENAANRD